MSELPYHYSRVPQRAGSGQPSLFQRAVQYPTKVVPARYIRWVPIFIAVPAVLWFFGASTWRYTRPPPPIFQHDQHDGVNVIPPLPPAPYETQPPIPHEALNKPRPPFHAGDQPSSIWAERAGEVRNAFIHAYGGYRKYAFPSDEVTPVDGQSVNNFVGWGVSVYDALDTMWIMGLDDFFNEGVKHIEKVDFFETENYAPFFETVIRYLGGLLSGYGLSGEPVLLKKADELGRGLMPVFNTPSGIPEYAVNLKNKAVRGGWAFWSVWSESVSCQMEFKYLAHLTGNQEYYNKVEHLMDIMHTYPAADGFPTMWDKNTGEPKNAIFSIGSAADSGYEYFLKQWLLTGRSEPKTRDLYLKSAKLIIEKLLYITPQRGLLYVTDTNNGMPTHTFEHLSCFLPGLFALGVQTLDLNPHDKELHLWAAQGLTQTCYLTYADQLSGLGPDIMTMRHYNDPRDGRWMAHLEKWEKAGRPGGVPPGVVELSPEHNEAQKDYSGSVNTYLLRPETVESIYLLWTTTKDEKWRQKGWDIFQAIETNAKTQYGYASIGNVYQAQPPKKNEMPSYFLAETLKYLYLLFMDQQVVPLDSWVFNTEAHPLPIFHWNETEKAAYRIP